MVEVESTKRNSSNVNPTSFSNSTLSHHEIASAHKLATRKMYLIVLISIVLLVGIVLLLFYVNDNVAGQGGYQIVSTQSSSSIPSRMPFQDIIAPVVTFGTNTPAQGSTVAPPYNIEIDSSDQNPHSLVVDIDDSLVAWWTFDSSYGADLSGKGNHLSSTQGHNPTVIEGKRGNGLGFSLDYVYGSPIDFFYNSGTDFKITHDMTVCGWVNTSDFVHSNNDDEQRIIIGKYYSNRPEVIDQGSKRGWFLAYLENSGNPKLSFRVHDGISEASIAEVEYDGLNKWHHICGVYNPSRYVKLYVDGVKVAQDITNVASMIEYMPPDSTIPIPEFAIGLRGDRGPFNYWLGELDDIQIFSRVLQRNEIRSLMDAKTYQYSMSSLSLGLEEGSHEITVRAQDESGHISNPLGLEFTQVPPSSLIAHWPFDNNHLDVSGNSHHGNLVGDAGYSTESKIGTGALLLDGDGDYVNYGDIDEMEFGENNYTISAWIKPSSAGHNGGSGYGAIISKYATSSTSRQWWLTHTSQGNLSAYSNPNGGSSGHNYLVSDADNLISQNEWTHVASQRDGNDFNLFINGVKVKTGIATNIVSLKTSPVLVGKQASGSNFYFNGLIDDVKVYSDAISEQELCVEAGVGSWVESTCILPAAEDSTDDLDGDGYPSNVDCDDTDPVLNTTITCYADDDGDGFGDSIPESSCLPTCEEGDDLSSNNLDCNDQDEYINPNQTEIPIDGIDNDCDGEVDGVFLLENWTFDSPGAVTADGGFLKNGAQISIDSKIGAGSLLLDGINDYAHFGNIHSFNESTPFSISAWIKPTNTSKIFQGIVDKLASTGYRLMLHGGGIWGQVRTPHYGALDQVMSTPILANEWYHTTFLFNGSELRLYVSGSLVSTAPFNLPSIGSISRTLSVGRTNNNNQYFEGNIDEVKIFSGVLSEDFICTEAQGFWAGTTCIPAEICSNGIDDDNDGDLDCEDAYCATSLLCIDDDNDNYTVGVDCNDNNPSLHENLICYRDWDNDTYGNESYEVCTNDCDNLAIFASLPNDCNDANNSINPGATEICGNGVDEDCSGADLVCTANEILCANLVDDDSDGDIDCDDADCATYVACNVQSCVPTGDLIQLSAEPSNTINDFDVLALSYVVQAINTISNCGEAGYGTCNFPSESIFVCKNGVSYLSAQVTSTLPCEDSCFYGDLIQLSAEPSNTINDFDVLALSYVVQAINTMSNCGEAGYGTCNFPSESIFVCKNGVSYLSAQVASTLPCE